MLNIQHHAKTKLLPNAGHFPRNAEQKIKLLHDFEYFPRKYLALN